MAIEDYLPKAEKSVLAQKEKRIKRAARVQKYLSFLFSDKAQVEEAAAHAIANKEDLTLRLPSARPVNSLKDFFGSVKDEITFCRGASDAKPNEVLENPEYQSFAKQLESYGIGVEEVNVHIILSGPHPHRAVVISLNHEKAKQISLNI